MSTLDVPWPTVELHLGGKHDQRTHGGGHFNPSAGELGETPLEGVDASKSLKGHFFEGSAALSGRSKGQQELLQYQSFTTAAMVNGSLRGQVSHDDRMSATRRNAKFEEKPWNVERSIDHLDQTMSPIPEPVRLYRHVPASVIGKNPSVGTQITDRGFMSTSTSRNFVENYGYGGDDGFTLQIDAPRGTHARLIDSPAGAVETLVGRGSTIEITGVEGNTVTAKLVRQDPASLAEILAAASREIEEDAPVEGRITPDPKQILHDIEDRLNWSPADVNVDRGQVASANPWPIEFHLQGKHNQKTHAKGATRVGDVNMKRMKPENVIMSSKLAEAGWGPDDPETQDLRETAALYGFKMVTPLRESTGVSMTAIAATLDQDTLMVGPKDRWGRNGPSSPLGKGREGGPLGDEVTRMGVDPGKTSGISWVVAHEAGHRWNKLSSGNRNRNDRLNQPLADFANGHGVKRPGGGSWTADDFSTTNEQQSLRTLSGGFNAGRFGMSNYSTTSREELVAETFTAKQHGSDSEISNLLADTLGWS